MPHERAGILLREEPLGNFNIEKDGHAQGDDGDGEHQGLVAEDPAQAPLVGGENLVESPFTGPVETAGRSIRSLGLHEARAEHRRQRQGDDAGYHDGQAQGHGKFMEKPPNQSTHEQQGNEHGHQRGAHGNDRETNLPRAFQRRRHRRFSVLHVPVNVLDHDDGIIHHKAHGDGDGHEGQVIQAVMEQIHEGEGPGQGERNADAGDEGRPEPPQKEENHQHHHAHAEQQAFLHVVHRGVDGHRAVGNDDDFRRRGNPSLNLGQDAANAVHRFDDVGIGLFENHHNDGGFDAHPPGVEVVLHPVHNVAQAAQPDGNAVGLGQDEGVIIFGLINLVVAGQRVKQIAVFHAAFGRIHIHLAEQRADILQAQAGGGELGRVDLDPHGGFLRARDDDLADPFHLAEALADNFISEFKDGGGQEAVGGHAQDQNGRVGRIDLAIGRRPRQVERQFAGGGIDGGLDIARRAVHRPVQIKLKGDVAAAQAADGSHFIDARDLSQPPFQGRGERGGHRGRVGSGQTSEDRDHRIIHARHGGDRERAIGGHARQKQPDGEQRRADGAADEWLGNTHVTQWNLGMILGSGGRTSEKDGPSC